MDIVGWMGERYKDKIKAWWFDSPYSLDPRGPHNSVTHGHDRLPVPLGAVHGGRQGWASGSAGDLQRRGCRDVPLHDPPGLLGRGIGQPRDPGQEPLPGRTACNGSAGRAWRIGPGCTTGSTREIPKPLYSDERGHLLRPNLQFPPGPDDVQRGHLPGRHDGPGVGGAVAPAEDAL